MFYYSNVKTVVIYARVYSDFFEQDNETKTKIETKAKNSPGYITTRKGTYGSPLEVERDACVFQKVTVEV